MPAGTILFSTFGARGDLYPYMAIGQELVKIGHRAVIATSESYREEVLGAGLEFQAVRPAFAAEAIPAMMDPVRGTEYLFRRVLLPSLRETVQDLTVAAENADVLVTHTTSLAGPIVAELQAARGLKWASGVVSPLALLSAHDAPAIPAAPHLAESNPPLNRFIVRALRRQYGAFLKPANTLRREMGLPSGGNILLRAAHSPTLALGLFSPHLAPPQPDWPSSLRAVGFCFASLHQSLAESVRRFLQSGEPPLLFLSATFSHHEENDELAHWMSTALAACQQLGARALFLGPPERLGENFLSIPYAPLAEVLPGVRALVHEGGIGTLALGLRAGTPMLLSPMAHDQPDTARMATRAGVARVLSRHEFMADKLVAELKSLLFDEGLKARVLALRNHILAEPGAAGAAQEIAHLLN